MGDIDYSMVFDFSDDQCEQPLILSILQIKIIDARAISTALSEKKSADIFKRLSNYSEHIINKYKGGINTIESDGITALFGSYHNYENHALRAFLAAHEILNALKNLNNQLSIEYNTEISLRIGLHTGEIVLKPNTDPYGQSKYVAHGSATEIAKRIQAVAGINQILVSESTKKLLEKFCTFEKCDNLFFSKTLPNEKIYQVTLKENPHISFADKSSGSTIIQRDEYVHIMRNFHEFNLNHKSFFIHILGEAGIGKTTLVQQIRNEATAKKIALIERHCLPNQIMDETDVFFHMAKKALMILYPDKKNITTALINKALSYLDMDDPVQADTLKHICKFTDTRKSYQKIEPEYKFQLKVQTITNLLYQVSQKIPLALIFEDLHWMDPPLQALLEKMEKQKNPCAKLFVMTTGRPRNYDESYSFREHVITLKPLNLQNSKALIDDMTYPITCDEPVKKKISTLSGGNPFFIRELVYWMEENKKLSGHPSEPNEILSNIPLTIQDVIAARLSSISAKEYTILKSAAVIGRKFNLGILSKISGISLKPLLQALQNLEAKDFLCQTSLFPNREYGFSHALMHKFIYKGIDSNETIELHKKTVKILRSIRNKALPKKYELIAYHAKLSGQKKIEYVANVKAAENLIQKSNYRESIEFLLRALEVNGLMENTNKSFQREADILFNLIEAYFVLGKYDDAQKHLRHLKEKNHKKVKDIQVNVLSYEVLYKWVHGELNSALQTSRRVTSVNPGPEIIMRECVRQTNILCDLGNFKEAEELALNSLQLLNTTHSTFRNSGLLASPEPALIVSLAHIYSEFGMEKEANHYINLGLKKLSETPYIFTKVYISVYISMAYINLQQYENAAKILHDSLSLSKMMNSHILRTLNKAAYAYVCAKLDYSEKDYESATKVLKYIDDNDVIVRRSQIYAWISYVFLKAGDTSQALKLSEAALQTARKDGERAREAWALYNLVKNFPLQPGNGNRLKECQNIIDHLKLKTLQSHIDDLLESEMLFTY